jgi:hypothetical protein
MTKAWVAVNVSYHGQGRGLILHLQRSRIAQKSAIANRQLAMSPTDLWHFLPLGYFFTITIETPILLLLLSPRHPWSRRLLAGIWLTACTYPIVTLVLPLLLVNRSRALFLLVAETFAPLAECVLFWLAFGEKGEFGKPSMWRDFAVITLANLASFLGGEVLSAWQWFGLL